MSLRIIESSLRPKPAETLYAEIVHVSAFSNLMLEPTKLNYFSCGGSGVVACALELSYVR